jgi:hypothetical protein
MDDDGLSAALLAAWDDEPHPSSLVSLPAELLVHVLKRLSAADLVALASTCSALRAAAAEPSHWRRLCASRWPQDDAGRGELSWRALYFDRDAAECATAAGDTSTDDLMHTIFIQHVVARRSQPPSWASFLDDAGLDVPGGAGAAEAVSSFRRVHGLGHGLGHDTCGVAHGCVFAFLGSRGAAVAVCTCSGKVHVCDDSTCSVEHTSADVAESTVVCSVTGRIRSHAFLTAHDEEDVHDEDGNPEPPEGGEGGSFMPGVWGRCVLLQWMDVYPHASHIRPIAAIPPPILAPTPPATRPPARRSCMRRCGAAPVAGLVGQGSAGGRRRGVPGGGGAATQPPGRSTRG